MYSYVLALAFLLQMETLPPVPVAPFKTAEHCVTEAQKRNNRDESLRTKKMREKGAAFVCLKVVLPV